MEDINSNVFQASPNPQTRSSPDGPMAILWDIENCPVPSDVRPEDVAGNIRMALRAHPIIKGAVMTFSAYGDFNAFPRRLREGCQRTGVKLIDVPNGRKDAADKAILVDMFLFALDNPPPSSIMLISGDVDFAPALHILGQRGYNVILVIPSGVGVSSALYNAGKFVWDWPTVARGEGFALAPKLFTFRGGAAGMSGYIDGCDINVNPAGQDVEEVIDSRDFSVVSQSLSEYNCNLTAPCVPPTLRSQNLPCGLNEVPTGPVSCEDKNESVWWPQTDDLNVLNGQLVQLLELFGGCLPISKVRAEYHKVFGRPLYTSESGVKLVNLFKKMGDTLIVEGKGHKKSVYLRNFRSCPSAPPLLSSRNENKKGKGTLEETHDVSPGMGTSDEYSDEERVVLEEHDRKKGVEKTNSNECCLEKFKHELREILVSYSCGIFLENFEAVYQQRYKKCLDFQSLGVSGLEELFDKVSEIVVLHEDTASKRKFLAALGG